VASYLQGSFSPRQVNLFVQTAGPEGIPYQNHFKRKYLHKNRATFEKKSPLRGAKA
jgi:hypothetical protein